MLNNIYKFCSSHPWTIPVAALAITLGVMGEQTKPVLSNQMINGSQNSSATPLLSQLREVKAQRSQVETASATENNRESLLQPTSKSSAKDLKTAPANTAMASRSQKTAAEVRNVPVTNLPTQDGIYLYGQSPKPNQIGQGYIVFEKSQSQVKGAMYMPSSEFSCFQGTIDRSGELAMTVNAAPDETSSNQVATNSSIPSTSNDEISSYAYSVALQDYHQIKSISSTEQSILQMCNQASTEEYRKLVK